MREKWKMAAMAALVCVVVFGAGGEQVFGNDIVTSPRRMDASSDQIGVDQSCIDIVPPHSGIEPGNVYGLQNSIKRCGGSLTRNDNALTRHLSPSCDKIFRLIGKIEKNGSASSERNDFGGRFASIGRGNDNFRYNAQRRHLAHIWSEDSNPRPIGANREIVGGDRSIGETIGSPDRFVSLLSAGSHLIQLRLHNIQLAVEGDILRYANPDSHESQEGNRPSRPSRTIGRMFYGVSALIFCAALLRWALYLLESPQKPAWLRWFFWGLGGIGGAMIYQGTILTQTGNWLP